MSLPLRTRCGTALLALYPEPWRGRYGPEMGALLQDDPPGASGLWALLVGASRAHARPRENWRASAPATRMRLAVSGVFCAWTVLSLAGLAFAKDTEDPGFIEAGTRHPLLALARGAVEAGAALGALCLILGGLPLVWEALRAGVARRDRGLLLALSAPVLALAGLACFTAILARVAPARGGGFPASYVLEILLPWTLAIGACALVCALAPRAVMRRVELSERGLRRACLAAGPLALAMCLTAAGILVYAPALWLSAPGLAAEATGPYGAGTGVMLAAQALAAVLLAELGVLGAARAWRAAHAGAGPTA